MSLPRKQKAAARKRDAETTGRTQSNKVTPDQKLAVVDFMKKHSMFACGRLKAPDAKRKMEKLSNELAIKVSSVEGGAPKTYEQCKRIWDSMRSEAKTAAMTNGKPKSSKTGGGYSSDEDDSSPMPSTNDKVLDRVMDIIGWEVGLGIGIKDELSSDEDSASSPTAVKLISSPIRYDLPAASTTNQTDTKRRIQDLMEELTQVAAANRLARSHYKY